MEFTNLEEKLLRLMPYWHYKIDKPFKVFLKDKMSLETYYCLDTLRQNGAMTMSELSGFMKISKQQTTQLIEALHNYDFVERSYKENDRRYITIQLTRKAVEYLEQGIFHNIDFITDIEKKLDPEELRQAENAIDILIKILSKHE